MNQKYMYEVGWDDIINKVEIERETKLTVWVKRKHFGGRTNIERCRKKSDYSMFFDTWEQAHMYIVEKWQSRFDYLKNQTDEASSKLEQFKAMKNPEQQEGI